MLCTIPSAVDRVVGHDDRHVDVVTHERRLGGDRGPGHDLALVLHGEVEGRRLPVGQEADVRRHQGQRRREEGPHPVATTGDVGQREPAVGARGDVVAHDAAVDEVLDAHGRSRHEAARARHRADDAGRARGRGTVVVVLPGTRRKRRRRCRRRPRWLRPAVGGGGGWRRWSRGCRRRRAGRRRRAEPPSAEPALMAAGARPRPQSRRRPRWRPWSPARRRAPPRPARWRRAPATTRSR